MNLLRAGALAVLLFAAFSSVGVGVEASNTAIRVPITSNYKIGQNQLLGPETIAFDNLGFGYVSIGDGTIRRVNLTDSTITVYAYVVKLADRTYCGQAGNATAEATCGRPLGLKFDKNYNLYVCDAYYGLLFVPRANPSNVTVLATSSNGVKFGFLNALALNAAEDTIYMTDTSPTDTRFDFLKVFFEAKPQGRLVRYNIHTGGTETLLYGLVFGNGVAFNHDESEIIINETSLKRVRRYYLSGPNAGQNDFFNSDIGGYPDNVEYDPVTGFFLLGCFSEAAPDVDAVINGTSQTTAYQTVLSQVPPDGFIVVMDSTGTVQRSLYDPTGQFVTRTAEAKRLGNYIYVGSVENPYLGRIPASLLTELVTTPTISAPI